MPDEKDILDDLSGAAYFLENAADTPENDRLAALLRAAHAEIGRLRAQEVKPAPSTLPVEMMVKDASYVINSEEARHGGFAGDLACHVLALAEENERLRAELELSKKAIEAVGKVVLADDDVIRSDDDLITHQAKTIEVLRAENATLTERARGLMWAYRGLRRKHPPFGG